MCYLKCRNAAYCFATAKISADLAQITEYQPHSAACPVDDDAMAVARFKDALKTELRRQYYRLKDLYDTMALLYPDGAALVPYESIRSSLKVWRRQVYPPMPRNLEDFCNQLANPDNALLLQYHSGELRTTHIRDANGDTHVCLADLGFLRHVEQEINIFQMDATFETTPDMEGAMQLFTWLGVYHNHVIPLIWFVMSRKTEAAYEAVCQNIRTNMPNANVQLIGSDFEIASRNAARRIFPEAFIVGCHFHYIRAILGKIFSLGLADFVSNHADANMFVRKILALAFLPSDSISAAFENLIANLSVATRRRLQPLINYYRNFWLERVGPSGFSIFGISNRTNNLIEAYHARLLHRLGRHPSPWDFLDKLKQISQLSWSHLEQMARFIVQRQIRYITVYRNQQLQRAWRLLYLQQINVERFLLITANIIGPQTIRKIHLLSPERLRAIAALEDHVDNAIAVHNNGIDPEFQFEIVAGFRRGERLRLNPFFLHDQAVNGIAANAINGDEAAIDDPDPPRLLAQQNINGRRRQRRRRRRREAPNNEPVRIRQPRLQNEDEIAVEQENEQGRPPVEEVNAAANPNEAQEPPPVEEVNAAANPNDAQEAPVVEEVNAAANPNDAQEAPVVEEVNAAANPNDAEEAPVVEEVNAAANPNDAQEAPVVEVVADQPPNEVEDMDVAPEAGENEAIDDDAQQLNLALDESDEEDLNLPHEVRCIVCLINRKYVAFVPCGHYSFCNSCAERVVNSTNQCPTCRQRILSILKIYNS